MSNETQAESAPKGKQMEEERAKRALEVYALVRTAFSSERAVLSWMRTSASLFTFGFSITKFFAYLENQQSGNQFSENPYRLGLLLVCLGIASLIPALVQHIQRLRKMKALGLPSVSRFFSLPIGATAGLLVIGVATLIGICLNWTL